MKSKYKTYCRKRRILRQKEEAMGLTNSEKEELAKCQEYISKHEAKLFQGTFNNLDDEIETLQKLLNS